MKFERKNTLELPFFVFIHLVLVVRSSEVPRPRGVSLSKAPLYHPKNENFTCLDNSRTIPYFQINDDFCDCLDASDEPGTSACPHGVFYCVNAGHKPTNIGSNRVNDGVCDCCDGSDEYASDVKCQNDCVELGKMARKEEMEREELMKAGKELRDQFSQKGIQERQKKKEKLLELEQNREEAEKIKLEKEKLREEAEHLENEALEYYRRIEEEKNKLKSELPHVKQEEEEMFHKYDLDKNDKVSVDEIQQFPVFDKDKDGQVTLEEAKYFLDENDEISLEEFSQNVLPKIKLVEEEQEVKYEEDVEHEHEEVEPREEETTYYDEETQKLVDNANNARKVFNEAETNVKNIQAEIDKIKEYLEIDFGTSEEFAPLLGECFEYIDHEYIYKLCPFDKTIQKPKSGSMETRLGSWGKWTGSSSKYESMLYERGQACWNGPQRTTLVKIACGNENKLISVAEPNKCEYVFEFVTPAGCFIDDVQRIHEEL